MNRLLTLAAASALGVVAYSGPSRADGPRSFTLVNSTRATITGMWVSNYDFDDRWHPVRSFHVLSPGDSTSVALRESRPCRLQLKLAFDNGSEPEWLRGFNSCASMVRIWYDWPDRVYRVSYAYG